MEDNDPPPDPKPGTRTLRRQENQDKQEYVIKVSLEKAIVDVVNKNAILDEIRLRVESASRATHRLSMAIHLFIRLMLVRVKLSDVVLPNFLTNKNATFAFQLMVGTDDSKKPIPEVVNFLRQYDNILPPTSLRYQGDGNTFIRAAEQYLTNYRTYLHTTFFKRQLSFCAAWVTEHNLPDTDAKQIARMINGWTLQYPYVPTRKVAQLVAFHQKFLGLSDTQRACDVWMKKDYEKVIVYFALLNNYMLRVGRKKGFLLAPVASIRANFIYIDTTVLYGIMKSHRLTNGNILTFKERRADEWDAFLHTKKWLTQNQRKYADFTYTIHTDGVAVSIHYRRPKLSNGNITQKRPNEGDRVIGVDPGRVMLFTGVEEDENGKWKVYKLSRKKYYTESGIFKAQKETEKWHKNIQTELNNISKYSAKGANIRKFMTYLSNIQKNSESLWAEYLKRRWGRQRFALYSAKKSTLDRFLQSLDDGSGRRVILAYGNAGFASGGKGELTVPTTNLFRTCSRWYSTVEVDEYRTSQIHSETDKRMSEVKEDGKTVRGLRWCYSTKGGKFVDRDVNAALNIKRCYEKRVRPMSLSRGMPAQALPAAKIIGRRRPRT